MSAEARAWVKHYSSGQFTPAFWRARLCELARPLSEHHTDYPSQPAMCEALRYLLARPSFQTKLF